MRFDKVIPNQLTLSERERFFLSAWFNLSHKGSLDSYRVRVMNPINILRELLAMYQPHADESDRKRVAEEVIEIFSDQPVIAENKQKYHGLDEFLSILKESLEETNKASSNGKNKTNHLLTQRAAMIRSFCLQAKDSLEKNLLIDSFKWLSKSISAPDIGLNNADKRKAYYAIERATRDLLSIAIDDGGSIETLFQHYRSLVAPLLNGEVFDFKARLNKVADHLTGQPKLHKIVFLIIGTQDAKTLEGQFGPIRLTQTPPVQTQEDTPEPVKKFLTPSNNKIFACVETQSRDGRAAGMVAFRQIGEMLDLMHFALEERSATMKPRFLLIEDTKLLILEIPDIIPNPESPLPTNRLEDFVSDLGKWSQRSIGNIEGKDRVFSAFRLYRVGAEAKVFESKLVNWWTAVEYLTRGGKSSNGPIGAGVENSLTYILLAGYVQKHLHAYKLAFRSLSIEAELPSGRTKLGTLQLKDLYLVLKDNVNYDAIKDACSTNAYLWMHLQKFLEHIAQPSSLKSFISQHERRLRWQIQRIYRTRCDIVHSGRQIVNASLLCANLEYYLKTVLRALIEQLSSIPTVTGPGEFFERSAYQHTRLTKELGGKPGADALLIQTLKDI